MRSDLVRAVKQVLGRSNQHVLYECRACGTTVEHEIKACPACGSSEIARYDLTERL